ncbi:MAG: hypothetical protein HEP71_29350 [Roseivirga sp.]|nr:hypothetical protein [Roseivirga sp.]
MRRIFSLLIISFGLISITAFTYHIDTTPDESTYTPLLTVDFESDKEGTDYRTNTFDDNASDLWTRSVSSNNGPNNNTEHTYSGFVGSSWWVGEDLDAPENPLPDPNKGGFMILKTLDISSFQNGEVEFSAYLAGNTGTIKRYRANDFLQFKYAFDTDIATGANSTGAVPDRADLTTGNYTIFGAFYGTGNTVGTSSALINDRDLDGDADHKGSTFSPPTHTFITATDTETADSLKNQFAQWKFTFDIPASAQRVSILIEARTTGGSEEIGIDQIEISAKEGVALPSTATVAATALLEGAYNGATLNTTLNGSIPTSQPYSTNGHSGGETAGSVPAGAVDWVLVELREAASAATALASTKVGSVAGFLMSDGSIKATDGTSDLTVSLSGNTGSDFFVVVYHRNHLPVMSASSQSATGTITIDFTSAAAAAYQGASAVSALSGGKFGMIAGDADGDGDVDQTDLTTWRSQNGNAFGYNTTNSDFNLDGVINAIDRNEFQQKNTSIITP